MRDRPDYPFQYLILRVVPSLARGERINAGVVVFCRQLEYLGAIADLDRGRLDALFPGQVDGDEVVRALSALCDVAEGRPAGGPLAAMDPSERFGWLASPASTAIQSSEVHTGVTSDPAATLTKLFQSLVR